MRNCSTCVVEYADYGQRCSLCRECKRTYDREYHKTRAPKALLQKKEMQRARTVEARQFIWDYLKHNPCVLCGEDDPIVLEFDHLDQTEKLLAVSEMATYSIQKIKAEIHKCRILCANCHRRHTASQLGWYKDLTR